ncbi:hypothetical protein KC946_01440 [Candidatus Saccharibacteria bacterium]|nr:hypothetical protein [Candidatus Saccharibacteria bacterium]
MAVRPGQVPLKTIRRGDMDGSLIMVDPMQRYETKEAAVIVAALAWVIIVGSTGIAAIIICGWKGAKSIELDWKNAKATFKCR